MIMTHALQSRGSAACWLLGPIVGALIATTGGCSSDKGDGGHDHNDAAAMGGRGGGGGSGGGPGGSGGSTSDSGLGSPGRDATTQITLPDGASSSQDGAAGDRPPAASDGGARAEAGADALPAVTGPCTPPRNVDQPIAKLTDTGCVDPRDPKKMAAIVIPYDVQSPLWSDSADKTRGFVVPAGRKIHVKECAKEPAACKQGPADDGKWVFPVGTVMVKNFLFDGKFVETRLFVRYDADKWVGYGYQWNEAQTEATIVPDERRRIMFNTGKRMVEWNYPSRLDCMKCHVASGGSTLGPETVQMNKVVGGMNQIDRFAAMGLFDAPVPKPYKTALVTPYASQAGSPPAGATLEQKARSYMHANCAFCHRPDGDFPNIDLRYDIPLKGTSTCNADPAKGDVGVPNATILKPGLPRESVIWLRMAALPDAGRMPQIGTYHVDTDGVKLVGDWITSIASCPL